MLGGATVGGTGVESGGHPDPSAQALPGDHQAIVGLQPPEARSLTVALGRCDDGSMARRNYLVDGLSGTGKSSVYEELVRRGYRAITTDRTWSYSADPDTGLPGGPVGYHTWLWDRDTALGELESPEPDVLFVCGGGRNRDEFLAHFTRIFNLRIDDDTMRRRLEARTEDDWPLGRAGVELMLELNRSDDDRPAGAIDIDATQPLDRVVDEILRQAGPDD